MQARWAVLAEVSAQFVLDGFCFESSFHLRAVCFLAPKDLAGCLRSSANSFSGTLNKTVYSYFYIYLIS